LLLSCCWLAILSISRRFLDGRSRQRTFGNGWISPNFEGDLIFFEPIEVVLSDGCDRMHLLVVVVGALAHTWEAFGLELSTRLALQLVCDKGVFAQLLG